MKKRNEVPFAPGLPTPAEDRELTKEEFRKILLSMTEDRQSWEGFFPFLNSKNPASAAFAHRGATYKVIEALGGFCFRVAEQHGKTKLAFLLGAVTGSIVTGVVLHDPVQSIVKISDAYKKRDPVKAAERRKRKQDRDDRIRSDWQKWRRTHKPGPACERRFSIDQQGQGVDLSASAIGKIIRARETKTLLSNSKA